LFVRTSENYWTCVWNSAIVNGIVLEAKAMALGSTSIYMASIKSLDERNLIAALLHDVHTAHVDVFSHVALLQTTSVVDERCDKEGTSFLTKTLPKLGKMLDRALISGIMPNCECLRLKTQADSYLPLFLGEFFGRVFDKCGVLLPDPCAESVRIIRQVTYCFYKYELPYTADQEREVVELFVKTEDDLTTIDSDLKQLGAELEMLPPTTRRGSNATMLEVAREARILLNQVFSRFDPLDIVPCHGPGAVATRQQLWKKFQWTNVSERITQMYPLDAFFYASASHVCDEYRRFIGIDDKSLPARVILVPKDSRGPRLISSEPVDCQWIQGGLREAIVDHVEAHPLTRNSVHFTSQEENRNAALQGSIDGSVVTLDLKEASDRVSLELVRLLFPDHVFRYLECCRSQSTVLPDKSELKLRKFAPMGSSLCFPIMALTIWALLFAAIPDKDLRKRILVYGDDVVVPRGNTRDATEVLEAFGLMVNADKSCTAGLFRESCGKDAFRGVDVTPVRFRTVWSSSQSPDVYASWIAYANSAYDRRYMALYDIIVGSLHAVYGEIPDASMKLSCPSLRYVEPQWLPKKTRTNRDLQKREWRVWDIKAPRIIHEMPGWRMLLRFFTEARRAKPDYSMRTRWRPSVEEEHAFCVRSYTRRGTSILVRRWR
jgi:hypothetical protein